jgi:hypothetical protein
MDDNCKAVTIHKKDRDGVSCLVCGGPTLTMQEGAARFVKEDRQMILELKPQFIHDAERMATIKEAVIRRFYDGHSIPIEWVNEYNELATRYPNRTNKSSGTNCPLKGKETAAVSYGGFP